MGSLSGLTIGDTTFAVLAATGGGDMPIRVILPKSSSDSSASGLEMLAWPNGMRYVYCASNPGSTANVTGYIPPEYMGNGSVYIADKHQVVCSNNRSTSASLSYSPSLVLDQRGNTVIGDSTSGADVVFEAGFSQNGLNVSIEPLPPAKTSILFFVNPN